jgi:hypothetical protein
MEHERVDRSYWNVNKYDLPHRLKSIYHDCGNYVSKSGSTSKGGPPICGTCDKVVPWFFFKCIKCETFFVRDFRHPKFCTYYPTCWEHTLELPWEHCPKHNFPPTYRNGFRPYVEPTGLNPREFTDEELAGIFDWTD